MKARRVHRAPWLLAGLFTAPAIAWSQESPPPKRVLMLFGHDPNAPGVVAFTNALQAIVRAESPSRVVFYDELLDLGRFPANEERREELVDYIAEKYRGFSFDVILTEGAWTLQFATERVSARFPGVPIVYGNAWEPMIDYSALPANVTGRHHLPPFAATFEMARALQPDAERVVLVGGTALSDSLMLATAVRDMTPLVGGMQLVVWQDWSYESLLQSVRTLSPRTITIFSSFARDRSGQHFNAGDLIASLTRLASAPVYGIARNWVGDGIVGGVTMDFGDDGTRTGRMLVQVLGGVSGLPLPPPEIAHPAQVVDWRVLERWGLSERQLPPGTEVLYRPPTVWQRFRTLFLAIAAIVAVQTVLITWLLIERRRRIRALHMVAESRDQLAHIGRVATLGELSAAISHELRQPLAAIRAHAEAGGILLDRTPSDPSEAREIFRDILSDDLRAVEVLDNIRGLLRKDDPVDAFVDLNGICQRAMELLLHDASRRGVQLRLSLAPTLPPVIGDAVQLQQVVLNLALNAMDAAQASPSAREVVLGTSAGTGEVEIFVRDSGPGLSPETRLRVFEPFFSTKTQGLGMGLAIVRTIVERHRGRINAENENAGGAVFRVQLPIAEPAGALATVSDVP